MTKILFGIAGGENKGSTRFRILNQLSYLEGSGLECATVSLPRSPSTLEKVKFVVRLLRHGISADVIFIQRTPLPPRLVWFLRRFCSPVIYDFDDAFYAKLSGAKADKFNNMLATVSAVVAGSPALAEYARQYSDDVYSLSTPIPREGHENSEDKKDEKITIGWIGYPENLRFLRTIEPTLVEILNAHETLQLMIITGDVQQEYPLYDRTDVIYYEWGRKSYLEQMKQADIGIRPLTDEPWTRAKSHTSIIEFMSLGIPVVVSPVGILNEIVEHGVSGFHATNESEWKKYLEELLTDTQLRTQMGAAARNEISEHRLWSDQYAQDLVDIIRESAENQQSQIGVSN